MLQNTFICLPKALFPKSSSKKARFELLAKVQYRLGSACFFTKNYKDAQKVLSKRDLNFLKNSKTLFPVFQNGSFILAISEQKLGSFSEALSSFELYLKDLTPLNAVNFYDAHFYAAMCAYELKQYIKALDFLKPVFQAGKKLNAQAQILHAKIECAQNKNEEAIRLLDNLLKHTGATDEHHLQALYEKGEIFCKIGKIEEGVVLIESTQPGEKAYASWQIAALNKLGSAYLELAQSTSQDIVRKAYFERSMTCLQKAISRSKSEESFLLLAQNYFLRITLFGEKEYLSKLISLAKNAAFEEIGLESLLEIELLLAKTESRLKRFDHLLKEENESLRNYPKVLYLKALDLLSENETNSAVLLLQKAFKTYDKKLKLDILKVLLKYDSAEQILF